jgi:hypothetical protein
MNRDDKNIRVLIECMINVIDSKICICTTENLALARTFLELYTGESIIIIIIIIITLPHFSGISVASSVATMAKRNYRSRDKIRTMRWVFKKFSAKQLQEHLRVCPTCVVWGCIVALNNRTSSRQTPRYLPANMLTQSS